MNLLNKPGIQLLFNKDDNKNSTQKKSDHIKTEHLINEKKISINNANNLYHYFIITLFVSFIIFSLYVLISNSNNESVLTNQLKISELFKELSNNSSVNLHSLRTNGGKVNIVIDCKSEDNLYKNLSSFKSFSPSIKIRVSNDMYQLWIEENYFNNDFISANEISHAINNFDYINVEKEIINENLIIVGTLKDLSELFILLENNNLTEFKFNINLIEDNLANIYYKLSID